MKDRLLTILLSIAATLAVTQLAQPGKEPKELTVDRLIVRQELIVSDTGEPWEKGFEQHNIPRGMVARSNTAASATAGGIWVRGRLIKCNIDDPFDDRFHAINRDGSVFKAPGHISWNIFLDGAWRQVAIIQGEGLEWSEVPREKWTGGNHPGRLRFQTFRPHHSEPLTDAIIGQGKMSIGGGGFGGGGLPYPAKVLELWGGTIKEHALATPTAPRVVKDDGKGEHIYAIIAIDAQGRRSPPSPAAKAKGLASLAWDSVTGGDAYIVVRDGKEFGPLRIEGSEKRWVDAEK